MSPPANRDSFLGAHIAGWGDNTHGQVGTNSTAAQVPEPTRIRGLPKIVKVSAGDRHALAVSDEGEVLAWGANHSGQLGSQHTGTSLLVSFSLSISYKIGAKS